MKRKLVSEKKERFPLNTKTPRVALDIAAQSSVVAVKKPRLAPVSTNLPLAPRTTDHAHASAGSQSQTPTAQSRSPVSIKTPKMVWHSLGFVTKMAIAMGFPVGVLVAGSLWLQPNADIAVAAVTALVAGITMTVLLSQLAALHGGWWELDGRPAQENLWWAAARSSVGHVAMLNFCYVLIICYLGLAGYGLWHMAALVPPDFGWSRLVILILGNALLVWLMLKALIVRRLAIMGIAISNQSILTAVLLSWRMYQSSRVSMLLGAVTTVLRQALAIGLVVAIILTLRILGSAYLPGTILPLAWGLASALAVAILLGSALQVEIQPWLRRYHLLVTAAASERRSQLRQPLSTAEPSQPSLTGRGTSHIISKQSPRAF